MINVPLSITAANITIDVIPQELTSFAGDAILLPTLSDGTMSFGLGARVKQAAGAAVEKEATQSAPIAVGAAVVTAAGKLKVSHIIHVPLVEQMGIRIGVENIRRATRAGLLAASHFQLSRLGIPGMGTGESLVPYDEAARAIIDEIRAYKSTPPSTIHLLDTDPQMLRAFTEELGE